MAKNVSGSMKYSNAILLIIFGIFNTTISCQTNLFIDEGYRYTNRITGSDSMYLEDNTITGIKIKPNTLKNGTYEIWRDSAKSLIYFKETINNGLETGKYFTYRYSHEGEFIGTVDSINVLSGQLNDCFYLDDNLVENFRYQLCYKNGQLEQINIINPWYRGLKVDLFKAITEDRYQMYGHDSIYWSPIKINKLNSIDTLKFKFSHEKLNEINYRDSLNNSQIFYKINQSISTLFKTEILENPYLWDPTDTMEINSVASIKLPNNFSLNLLYSKSNQLRAITIDCQLKCPDVPDLNGLQTIRFEEMNFMSSFWDKVVFAKSFDLIQSPRNTPPYEMHDMLYWNTTIIHRIK